MGFIKSLTGRLKRYGSLVMFSHTIFSLPFGLAAMVWAAGGVPEARIFFWIIVALFGARNGANAFNRIADREYDKKNPRTAGRDMPQGRVRLAEAYGVTAFCFIILALAAFMLNTTCLLLLPLAIAIFIFYSYSKRFTWLCHIILGMACAGAPVGAWLAVTGEAGLTSLVMAAAVTCWVAGFDIIYAIPDIDFDRREGLRSIPARFGPDMAKLISAFLHICALGFLTLVFFAQGLGFIYLLGVGIIGILLIIEHLNTGRTGLAAYGINQAIGVVFIVFSMLDYIL